MTKNAPLGEVGTNMCEYPKVLTGATCLNSATPKAGVKNIVHTLSNLDAKNVFVYLFFHK